MPRSSRSADRGVAAGAGCTERAQPRLIVHPRDQAVRGTTLVGDGEGPMYRARFPENSS